MIEQKAQLGIEKHDGGMMILKFEQTPVSHFLFLFTIVLILLYQFGQIWYCWKGIAEKHIVFGGKKLKDPIKNKEN